MVSSSTDNDDPIFPPAPTLPGRRERTPRPALSKEAIVAAAITVLKTDGVDGLSMRLVAKRLGTGAASLYVHVANKEELLELVFDELVGRVPIPAPDPDRWQQQVREVAIAIRDVLRTNSQVALAGLGRIPTSPPSLIAAEGILGLLQAGGLPPKVIGMAADLLSLYIIAGVFEDSLFEGRGLSDEEMGQYAQDIARFYAALPGDRFPLLTSMAGSRTRRWQNDSNDSA